MGGGFETALACDIIVAAENAVFALPEPRVGLIAGSGVHRLPRMIGQKAALGMILTGRRVSAAEGRELGFVNEVVPEGEALAAARRWAAQILECSPMAIRASKQVVYKSLDEPTLTSGDDPHLSGAGSQSEKPGLCRRAARLRRAPQAELAEPVERRVE